MNKRQKIVQDAFLNNEEAVIKRLKQVYNQSLKDIEKKAKELQDRINELDTLAKLAVDADEKAKILSMKQAKVYQKQYQDALKKQVSSILDNMQVEEFKTVSEYLNKCYEEAWLGTMYDLQGQGIPLVIPLDQEAMVRAVQLDSKISNGLYSRLGEDVALLKKKIIAQVSRGIATGMTFQQVAQQLAGYTNIGYNNAVRIIRTEGHRIQVQSAMDACYKAKDKGANIVKSWDSTLDGRTRPSHQKIDGEIKELDEKFSNGLMFPGDPNGGAAEVVNCRCALLQKARFWLESSSSKMDNFTKEIKVFDSKEAYEEYKKDFFSENNVKYMKYVEGLQEKYKTKKFDKILAEMTDEEYKHFKKLEKARPNFYGMYQGQDIIKIKAADYTEFKKEYLKAVEKIAKSSKMKMNLQLFAKMAEEKFTKYSLNPEKAPDKAKAFKDSLGYDLTNYDRLIKNIEEHIDESKFVEKGDGGFGMRYEYIMEITSENGKKANVLTAWIDDNGEKRLVSVYVTKKKVTE